jgi:hypothetical protein
MKNIHRWGFAFIAIGIALWMSGVSPQLGSILFVIGLVMIFARFHVVNVLWHVASSEYAWPNELQASCIQLTWQANCDVSPEEFNQHSRKPK